MRRRLTAAIARRSSSLRLPCRPAPRRRALLRGTRPMPSVADEPAGYASDAVQRALVKSVQRAWIVSAMAEIVCERGPEMTSVRQIAARAGVSRRRFYELFENSDDCFAATFEEAVAGAAEHAAIGYRSHRAWTDRLRAALVGLPEHFES